MDTCQEIFPYNCNPHSILGGRDPIAAGQEQGLRGAAQQHADRWDLHVIRGVLRLGCTGIVACRELCCEMCVSINISAIFPPWLFMSRSRISREIHTRVWLTAGFCAHSDSFPHPKLFMPVSWNHERNRQYPAIPTCDTRMCPQSSDAFAALR